MVEINFHDLSARSCFKKDEIQQVYATKNRKEFMNYIINPQNESFQTKNVTIIKTDYPIEGKVMLLLQGNEGIGKTYTLGLLAHVLKNSAAKDQIRVFYIPNCLLFSEDPSEAINDEINKVFPELNWIDFKNDFGSICRIMNDYYYKGIYTVFIADQLNNISSTSLFLQLFSKLAMIPWKIQIYSQSATNLTNENFKILFKCATHYSCDHFFTANSVKNFIRNLIKEKSLKFNLTDEDFKSIFSLVKENPREIDLILTSNGNTLNEKIENYIEDRGSQIFELHNIFYENSPFKSQLNESIFFMDLDCFYKSMGKPIINNQFMKFSTIKQEGKTLYKISSSFPLASLILKQSCKYEKQPDFFEMRLNQLKKCMNSEKDGGVLGTFYEELIQIIFEDIGFNRKGGNFYAFQPEMNARASVKFFLVEKINY